MALTSTDQYWGEKLKIVQQETEQAQAENAQAQAENAQLKLMISAAKPGQSPGDDRTKEPYDKDWPPPAPLAPKLAGLRINPNTILLPKEPAPAESDDDYGEGEIEGYPGWKLAGGPQLPNFKPMGRVIKGTRKGVLSPEESKITRPLQIGPQAMDYPPPSELDRWLQLYQRNGGSLRHLDPDLRRLILQRGAMKANLPANNIRRLKDTGHMTIPQNPDGTGPLRIIDLLGPQNPPPA